MYIRTPHHPTSRVFDHDDELHARQLASQDPERDWPRYAANWDSTVHVLGEPMSMRPSIIIWVYDLSSRASFDYLVRFRRDDIGEHKAAAIPAMVVAHKLDVAIGDDDEKMRDQHVKLYPQFASLELYLQHCCEAAYTTNDMDGNGGTYVTATIVSTDQ